MLGTSLEMRFVCDGAHDGALAEAAVLAEIDRLTAIFNAYDACSELSRWQQQPPQIAHEVSPELAAVLTLAESWRRRTAGAFNPAAEALTRLWREAAARGEVPDEAAIVACIGRLNGPLWAVDPAGRWARRQTEAPVTLNSIAKGYVVDCALLVAQRTVGVRRAVVNAGGDLVCWGESPFRVAIADPFSDAENSAPVAVVELRNMAVATSGSYRRGFQAGGQWHSHVLDPRTGWPVNTLVSASVLAPTCLEADVLATAYSVMGPAVALDHADHLEGVGVLLVESSGAQTTNSFWRQHSVAGKA